MTEFSSCAAEEQSQKYLIFGSFWIEITLPTSRLNHLTLLFGGHLNSVKWHQTQMHVTPQLNKASSVHFGELLIRIFSRIGILF
jgi:hypothetical protein